MMTIPLQVLVSMGWFVILLYAKGIVCLWFDQGIKKRDSLQWQWQWLPMATGRRVVTSMLVTHHETPTPPAVTAKHPTPPGEDPVWDT